MVLQMEIDRLGNFHGAPPVVWLTGNMPTLGVYTMMRIGWREALLAQEASKVLNEFLGLHLPKCISYQLKFQRMFEVSWRSIKL